MFGSSPDLTNAALKLPDPETPIGTPSRERFVETVSRSLGLYSASRGLKPRDPVILFVDDAQWADPASLSLLGELAPMIAKAELWVVVGIRDDGVAEHLKREIGDACPIDEIELEALSSRHVQEISTALVGERDAPILLEFLNRHAEGLPLFMTELINHLWDRGALLNEDRETGLEERLAEIDRDLADGTLHDLIVRRLHHLPNSTKRLAALAAVIGQVFEAGLLREAAGEHRTVVEVGLEILLERWVIRQFADQWNETRPESDIVLWAGGARRGKFEFAHKLIRTAIYENVNLIRRQVMHREVAEALEAIYGKRADPAVEQLAHHYSEATLWERALPYLVRSAERAAALFDLEQAEVYYERAHKVADRLAAGHDGGARAGYEAQAQEIRSRLEQTRPQPAPEG